MKSLFLHRRKFLRANVVSALKRHAEKPQIDELLDGMGFAPDTRTEQLGIDTLLEFTERVRKIAPDWSL